jgi:hypothetical protein
MNSLLASVIVTLAAAAVASAAHAQKAYMEVDVTGLVGKGWIQPVQPKGVLDVQQAHWGNDYYHCGGAAGSMAGWVDGMGISVLRKGRQAPCHQGTMVLAVTEYKNDKSGRVLHSVITSIEVKVPANETLVLFGCGKTADVAVAKPSKGPQFTRFSAAWRYEHGELTPVENLGKVRCDNEGHGV